MVEGVKRGVDAEEGFLHELVAAMRAAECYSLDGRLELGEQSYGFACRGEKIAQIGIFCKVGWGGVEDVIFGEVLAQGGTMGRDEGRVGVVEDFKNVTEPEGGTGRNVTVGVERNEAVDEGVDGRLREGKAAGNVDFAYGGRDGVDDGGEHSFVAENDGGAASCIGSTVRC